MYPKITQPLTKTVVRTKSPIKTPQPELLSKTLETSNSRNKLHSPTPTKTQGNTASSKPKSPQQVLKIWYSQHNSVVAGAKGLGGSRTQTTPSKTSITERDSSLDYRSLSAKSPNKNSSQGFQTVGRYNSTEEQENVNSVSQYARKEGSYASSTRDREYNSSHKSSRMSDGDNENLRKHLNGEMRVNLGSYVLQKVMGRICKKEAMNRLVEYFIHLRLLHQGKLLRLSPVQPEPSERKMQSLTERKDKKKADEYFEYQEEETETESVSYASSREGNLFDGSYMESVDRRQYMGSLKEPSSQKMYRGPSNSIIPENVNRDRANRTAEDWAEMFIRKVDLDTRREKGMSKQELENERELQQKRERMRIAVRAAVLIQRRFRYYVERKRRMQEMVKRKKMASHRSAKIERENVVMSSERSAERKNLSESSLGVVEQLTSELGLAKKKMAYLQKENENLLNNIKNLESNMEKRVNEKLTIERARIKDTLNEYSVFIDKLLEEKKQLEQKNEAQAKLITELCARLENKDTVEENAKSLLLEENKELIQPSQYFSIVQEKEALKTKLSMLGSKMPTLETKEEHSIGSLNKSYSQPKEELSMSSNIMKSSSQSSLLSESHKYPEGKRKVMHKGSFGRVDEDCFQVVLEQSTMPKLTTNTYFSTQGNETSRKNSQQSQAESAKFQYNSHSHESSSYFPNNMNKSSTEFMYLSEELMSDTDRYRQATPTKARKNRAEMKSEEKKPRSAREAHEFSFEAKTHRNNESEFTEPFILSVALQGKSPRRNNDLRKSAQEVESQHSQSMLVNSESRKSMLVDRDIKSSRERLQSARNEKRVSREKEEVELPEIDNLIANLSTRLYIEEGDKGKVRKDSRENQNNREYIEKGNIYEKKLDEDEIPSLSRGSSTDLQSERSEEIVNKSESVFQRLSRSVPKSFV